MDARSIAIAGNDALPCVGLGFWKIENQSAADVVVEAIKTGYRHLDCACDYGNEAQVGQGVRRAIDDGFCRRDDLWITSKLWNTYHRPEHVRKAAEKSLRDLQVDSLDLYLIHFPIALKYVPIEARYPPGWFYDPEAEQPSMVPDSVPVAETWGAMEELITAGLVRHIGVSNFGVALLRDLLAYCTIRPAALQVESHPYLVQPKLLRYCQQEQIAYTAFSPLGAGSYVPLGMAQPRDSVLKESLVQEIAATHQKTAAQVVLRWGIQRGTAVIPKTRSPQRLKENINLFNFALSEMEMQQITGLDRNRRFNDPGEFCESAFGCFYPIYE